MSSSLKVVPQPVRRQVEDALRAAIVAGRFLPGDHLPDRLLCETFGTSRSVVREAVRLLEAEGLVVVHPNRGPFVAMLSVEDARDAYEVRAALEALAGEGFARRASEAERAALRAVYEELRDAPAGISRDALLDLKRRFYEILTTGSRNALATRMLERLLIRNSRLRATSLSSPNRLPKTVEEIGRIIEAVERRDAAAAAAACRAHVEAAADVAIRILRERDAGTAGNDRPDHPGNGEDARSLADAEG
ncbi:GntR family transcriptional regulator [Burkholderia sp. WAC0059]|uniref:GntR family transcriptional regulator n=1 Tax=Burkholderia sp. WAC0059 TaxID=2066022 RepID=UPI000C7EBE59|nr:GntR family transcriptional regulator [Burkholderia sp. WAC0059]PLZ02192.1 GntR family transcriptional regulator [Burkholderia sp. WAC0059]